MLLLYNCILVNPEYGSMDDQKDSVFKYNKIELNLLAINVFCYHLCFDSEKTFLYSRALHLTSLTVFL
jgi:hypothetical protein